MWTTLITCTAELCHAEQASFAELRTSECMTMCAVLPGVHLPILLVDVCFHL